MAPAVVSARVSRAAREAVETKAPRARLWPRSALVIEADANVAHRLARALKHWGYGVCEAHCAAEALAIAQSQPIHLALLDLDLPDMDGCALARALRTRDGAKDALIVGLKETTHSIGRPQVRDAGFDHLLVKPVELATLEYTLVYRVH